MERVGGKIELESRKSPNCVIDILMPSGQLPLKNPMEKVIRMLQTYRDERPIPGAVVQFSRGEPILYPYFLEALGAAREMGFSHIQAATNGLAFPWAHMSLLIGRGR